MNRDDLVVEIYNTFNELASNVYAKHATNCLMKKIDAYVEDAVRKACIEAVKNFSAI